MPAHEVESVEAKINDDGEADGVGACACGALAWSKVGWIEPGPENKNPDPDGFLIRAAKNRVQMDIEHHIEHEKEIWND